MRITRGKRARRVAGQNVGFQGRLGHQERRGWKVPRGAKDREAKLVLRDRKEL
jgi:hypothetical protein